MITDYLHYTGREALIAQAILSHGDWNDIYRNLRERNAIPLDRASQMLSRMRSKAVTILDKEYPPILRKDCPNPPFVLFYYGDIALAYDYTQILTVVGSREPTSYSCGLVKELCGDIADKGYIVASGLAKGIDTAAAEATARLSGKAIAVLGCGIDRVYPLENKELRDLIAFNGLLLSEYPGYEAPDAHHFPFRNRLLASLGHGTFVGEAQKTSGSMITVAYAAAMNRDIAALPFPAKEEVANNRLIKTGAAMIETVKDLELFMNTAMSRENEIFSEIL